MPVTQLWQAAADEHSLSETGLLVYFKADQRSDALAGFGSAAFLLVWALHH